jgi:hypothetical protein
MEKKNRIVWYSGNFPENLGRIPLCLEPTAKLNFVFLSPSKNMLGTDLKNIKVRNFQIPIRHPRSSLQLGRDITPV